MTALRKAGYSSLYITAAVVLTACLPPAFFPFAPQYAVTGDDVPLTLTVTNTPSSVTCLSDSVSFSNTGTNTWEGTIPAGSLSLGDNVIDCRANNNFGTTSQTVGTIVVIENTPPTLEVYTSVTVYDNDGSVAIDEPLVDTGTSSNIEGAEYVLDSGTLPAGLNIDSSNGHLVGTINVGSTEVVSDIYLQATTAAGSDVNDSPITITIEDGSTP